MFSILAVFCKFFAKWIYSLLTSDVICIWHKVKYLIFTFNDVPANIGRHLPHQFICTVLTFTLSGQMTLQFTLNHKQYKFLFCSLYGCATLQRNNVMVNHNRLRDSSVIFNTLIWLIPKMLMNYLLHDYVNIFFSNCFGVELSYTAVIYFLLLR